MGLECVEEGGEEVEGGMVLLGSGTVFVVEGLMLVRMEVWVRLEWRDLL